MHFFGFRVGTWQSVVISCLVDTKYLSEERKGLVASILRSSKWDQAMFSILHRKKLDVFVLNQLERLCPEVTVPQGALLRWPARHFNPYKKDGRSSIRLAKLVLVLPFNNKDEHTVILCHQPFD